MLTSLTESQKETVLMIAGSIGPCRSPAFLDLVDLMSWRSLEAGEALFEIGRSNSDEYFLIDGMFRTYVLSPDGEEVTLGFSVGPATIPPSISRCLDGVSAVCGEALCHSTLVPMQNEHLVRAMMSDSSVQQWGDEVMRLELVKRTQREIALATQTAKQRLEQFRVDFPSLEARVPHPMIASYLGVTPVTLSRLRNS